MNTEKREEINPLLHIGQWDIFLRISFLLRSKENIRVHLTSLLFASLIDRFSISEIKTIYFKIINGTENEFDKLNETIPAQLKFDAHFQDKGFDMLFEFVLTEVLVTGKLYNQKDHLKDFFEYSLEHNFENDINKYREYLDAFLSFKLSLSFINKNEKVTIGLDITEQDRDFILLSFNRVESLKKTERKNKIITPPKRPETWCNVKGLQYLFESWGIDFNLPENQFSFTEMYYLFQENRPKDIANSQVKKIVAGYRKPDKKTGYEKRCLEKLKEIFLTNGFPKIAEKVDSDIKRLLKHN